MVTLKDMLSLSPVFWVAKFMILLLLHVTEGGNTLNKILASPSTSKRKNTFFIVRFGRANEECK